MVGMSKLRFLFTGSSDFSAAVLKELVMRRAEAVAGVVTYPPLPKGRGHNRLATPVASTAKEFGLPLYEENDMLATELLDWISALAPDIGVVLAFKILPREYYLLPRLGTVNLHPSLLPELRGAAPVRWAIMRGYERSGLTVFFLQDRPDTGDIVLQRKFEIGADETAGELFERLVVPAADAITDALDIIESGDYTLVKQNTAKATKAPRIKISHRRIDWSRDALWVHNRIRGLSPEPGAVTILSGKNILILRSRIYSVKYSKAPGEIIEHIRGTGIVVGCGIGTISITRLKPENRREMTADEFARGYLKKDSRFL